MGRDQRGPRLATGPDRPRRGDHPRRRPLPEPARPGQARPHRRERDRKRRATGPVGRSQHGLRGSARRRGGVPRRRRHGGSGLARAAEAHLPGPRGGRSRRAGRAELGRPPPWLVPEGVRLGGRLLPLGDAVLDRRRAQLRRRQHVVPPRRARRPRRLRRGARPQRRRRLGLRGDRAVHPGLDLARAQPARLRARRPGRAPRPTGPGHLELLLAALLRRGQVEGARPQDRRRPPWAVRRADPRPQDDPARRRPIHRRGAAGPPRGGPSRRRQRHRHRRHGARLCGRSRDAAPPGRTPARGARRPTDEAVGPGPHRHADLARRDRLRARRAHARPGAVGHHDRAGRAARPDERPRSRVGAPGDLLGRAGAHHRQLLLHRAPHGVEQGIADRGRGAAARHPPRHPDGPLRDPPVLVGVEARRDHRRRHRQSRREHRAARPESRRLPGLARLLHLERAPLVGLRVRLTAQLRGMGPLRERALLRRAADPHLPHVLGGPADPLDGAVDLLPRQLGRPGLLLPAGLRLLPLPHRHRRVAAPLHGRGGPGRRRSTSGRRRSRSRRRPAGNDGTTGVCTTCSP